jgi:NitT/TauT family transport system permease protein
MKRNLIHVASSVAVLAAVLLLWRIIIWAFAIPVYMLPTPKEVATEAIARFPSLISSFLITAEAAAGGLIAAIVIGVTIGLFFAQFRWVRKLLMPYTILLQTVPIIAIAPLIIMWAGAGIFAVSLITFIICIAPIIANTTQGLISVDENMVNLFLMQNASSMQILFKLRLPHALPALFTGLRISSGIAVIGAIIGELFAGSVSVGHGGLGYSITYAQAQMQTSYLFALVMASTALGFLFFFVVMFLEYFFLHNWHESIRTSDNQ